MFERVRELTADGHGNRKRLALKGISVAGACVWVLNSMIIINVILHVKPSKTSEYRSSSCLVFQNLHISI